MFESLRMSRQQIEKSKLAYVRVQQYSARNLGRWVGVIAA